ncbi:MAG: hypothetical protein CSA15_06635 [Candidatus Delongbacteria bacterium]|nr:MAG: hypothetical protein CSA15_06635 [Candidatus Delongbacteria bacterium]
MNRFYPLEVVNVEFQTDYAKEISFALPNEIKEDFCYHPGQYITLRFNLDGQDVRRSYSLCSSPNEDTLRIAVKRLKGGLVSNHINDTIKVGDMVEVLPPDGRFFADIKPQNYKTYYLFAGGSGITPILSILKSVLLTEKHSYVNMVYANRSQDTIMFQRELKELQAEYSNRFILVHYLSKPIINWLKKDTLVFEKGRMDSQATQAFMDSFPPYAQNVEYYICGPEKMKDSIVKSLKNIDVPDNRIFIESFGGGKGKKVEHVVENSKLKAILQGETVTTQIPKGKTVLRALLKNGNEPPYSCEGGVCSTCKCKVVKGKVAMKKNFALTEKEIKDGYVLSCQSLPLTEEIEVIFE